MLRHAVLVVVLFLLHPTVQSAQYELPKSLNRPHGIDPPPRLYDRMAGELL